MATPRGGTLIGCSDITDKKFMLLAQIYDDACHYFRGSGVGYDICTQGEKKQQEESTYYDDDSRFMLPDENDLKMNHHLLCLVHRLI
eukprot:6985241-Ditylum_brightwellii.AAC.1